ILPPVTLNFSAKAFMFKNKESRKIKFHVKSNLDSLTGKLKINVPEDWKADPEIIELSRINKGEDRALETTITSLKDDAAGIITGVRALNTNDWLQNFSQKLLAYVKQGGNLIIQYNTNNRIGPLIATISPYPFTISRERVTDENAEVRFVKPSSSVLNFPNKI